MVKTKSVRTRKTGTTSDRSRGNDKFNVPYFDFNVNGYEGIAVLVTNGSGELKKGIDAFRIRDEKAADICDLLYKENDGTYIALIGVKTGKKNAAKRRIGGFVEGNPTFGSGYEDMPGIDAQHLTVHGRKINHHTGEALLTEIVQNIKYNSHEYQMMWL